MNPVVKIGGGLVLVNFVYGIINLFNLGEFLTLIPLTTFFIAIIFVVTFFVNVAKGKWTSFVLFYLFLVFLLQSNSVFEIFFSQEKIKGFQQYLNPYFNDLEFFGVLFLWILIFLPAIFKKKKNFSLKILSSVLFILSIVVYFIFEGSFVTFISFFLLVVAGSILKYTDSSNKKIDNIVTSLVLILILVLMNTVSIFISD